MESPGITYSFCNFEYVRKKIKLFGKFLKKKRKKLIILSLIPLLVSFIWFITKSKNTAILVKFSDKQSEKKITFEDTLHIVRDLKMQFCISPFLTINTIVNGFRTISLFYLFIKISKEKMKLYISFQRYGHC